MLLNVLLTTVTLGLLLVAGELVGRKLVATGPLETRTVAGVGALLLFLAGGVGLGLVVGGSIRWWLAATTVAVIAAALANFRSVPSLARSLPVAVTLGLAVVASMAMASPFTPFGQTDAGLVFESRIPNRPADNRLPYRTGQFILHRLDPDSEQYFIDWAVTDRTPLTAAAATAIVGTISSQVPAKQLWYMDAESVQWTPQDKYGYWLYRSVLIAFNALVPLGVAAMGIPWLGRRVGSLGSIVSALWLFSMVETMYTWPKFAAVALGSAAVGVLLLKRPWLAGILGAAAYLAHPVGALALGAGLVVGWFTRRVGVNATLKTLVAAAATIAPWVIWVSAFQRTSSRMVLYPIGWLLSSGKALREELPMAVQQLVERLPWGPINDRWTSFWESSVPVYFMRIVSAPSKKGMVFGAYDRTIPGMVGIVGWIPLLVGMVESLRRRRGILVGAVTTLVLALAFWGVWPRALGADMLQPIIPFLALGIAFGMWRHRILSWLLPLTALETFLIANYTIFDGSTGAWTGTVTIATYAVFLAAVSALGIAVANCGSDSSSPLAGPLRWFGFVG